MLQSKPPMRLRRDLRGFLFYGGGSAAVSSVLLGLLLLAFVGGGSAELIHFILVALLWILPFCWWSGRVRITEGSIVAGNRFWPQRIALTDVSHIEDGIVVVGRAHVDGLLLCMRDGSSQALRLSGALGSDSREQWSAALTASLVP